MNLREIEALVDAWEDETQPFNGDPCNERQAQYMRESLLKMVQAVAERARESALQEAFDVVDEHVYEDPDGRSSDYQQGAADVRQWAFIALGNLMSGQPQVVR